MHIEEERMMILVNDPSYFSGCSLFIDGKKVLSGQSISIVHQVRDILVGLPHEPGTEVAEIAAIIKENYLCLEDPLI